MTTYIEAVEQTITAGEQIHQIVNGTATTEVTVEDGSKVPSIRKALLDNFYFKDPIAWQVGQTENVFNQLRQFTDGSWWYAPSATASKPITMNTTPVGDNNWKVYSVDAVVKLTPQIREALRRSYAEAGYVLVNGSFEVGGTVTTKTQALLFEASGKAYSWGGALPKVVTPGSSPTPISAGSWVLVDTSSFYLRTNNSWLIASAVAKMKAGQCKLVCVGDSITYGHDTFSSGTIPPVSPHSQPHVAIPYPEQTVLNINSAFGVTGNTVENRGFSGDTVKISYGRWSTNPSADLAIVMFGINDATIGGIGISVEEYTEYLILTIERYLRWGCGVVVCTSSLMSRGNEPRDVYKYRAAAKNVANQYGCPVFDAGDVGMQNLTSEIYSDSVHFNQAGYSLLGCSMASFLLSGGVIGLQRDVGSDQTYPVGYLSRMVGNGVTTAGAGAYAVQELITQLTRGTSQSVTFSFFSDSEACEIYSICQIPKGTVVSFDFGAVRGRSTRKALGATSTNDYTVAGDTVRSTGNTPVFLGRIIGRGWHSVTISAPPSEAVSHAFINAFSVSPCREIDCTNSAWPMSTREFVIFDPQPTLTNLPPSSSKSDFVLPAYLFGSLLYRGPGYFASTFVTVEIRNFSGGYMSYSKQIITLTLNGGNVVFTPIVIDNVGTGAVTVASVSGATIEGLSSSGNLTFNLSRPSAGYIEMRFSVADVPDIRFGGMPA